MRCRKPRTVGFQSDGKTIAWSQKNYSKEYPTFQLPCGKCTACRLEYARSWAVRATHEASIHPQNCFITLTYDDLHLNSEKLVYDDFQAFIQALRDRLRYENNEAPEIGYMAVGEYGNPPRLLPNGKWSQGYRPHFHACLFNYRPDDPEYEYSNELGDKVYSSKFLSDVWGKGTADFGDVTFKSAGYCARYAVKKLVHGNDQDHDYQPIFKTSRKYAIGKRWLEKHWPDAFNYGRIIIQKPDGTSVKTGIPRYYEKWLREHHMDQYIRYLTDVKYPRINQIEAKCLIEALEHIENNWNNPLTKSRAEVEHLVLTDKINRTLQKHLKL